MSSNDTQVTFELPKGFVDENGQVHKVGVMRLANAADEIIPMNDPRVKLNPAYLSILILERVVHDENAYAPILVTLSGRIILPRLVHP